jgi:uncharacterized protein (TIGR02186 family)
MRAAAILLAAALAAPPALAGENLVSGLSQDRIEIRSTYNGTEITVFGAVERPESGARPDIAVVVRGPRTEMRVRRKDRVLGIWINTNREILYGMPGYYFAASNRPLADIASGAVRRQYALGLAALTPRAEMGGHDPEPFVQAAIRAEERNKLYAEEDKGVEFLSGTLFRARVPLPAAAPRGDYTADVYLLRDGRVIGPPHRSKLTIDQTGTERRVYDFSRDNPLAYGLSTVLMAMAMGWLSSLAFRRME